MTNSEYKKAFIRKHGKGDWHVDTSAMDEYGQYVKTYIFEDGAQLTEVNGPEYVTEKVEIKGVQVEVTVKMFVSECWNTDDARSYKWYEKY